ncbi:MAG: ATP-binding cassette domain-containing protein, partial [Myxococcota bacterium]|nr:ATP-binding cassette domain-containing protein [Myxococcota bacterium]
LGMTSPELTLFLVATLPPGIALAKWTGRRIRRRAREAQDEMATANARLKEAVVGIETVQIFTAESAEHTRYVGRIMEAFRRAFRVGVLRTGLWTTVQLGGHTALGLILWFGGRQVIAGELTPGELTAFLAYTLMVTGALGSLASVWGNLQRAVGASGRVFDLLAEAPGITDGPTSLGEVDGRISFHDVSFAYPGRPELDVVSHLDLTVEPGEFVAIVGRSGAGKTTLTALLQRFHDPQSGQITLDGHPLPSLVLADLRGVMASVRQEPVLFADTLAENIRYGRPDADDGAVAEAANAANLDELIERLPDGLDTRVGERGVRLSGGQRQRVSIARAMLSDPRILILDEATCHLDAGSEALVHAAIDRLMVGRTTLVIAHRLSTVVHADRILVLEDGRVVDSGSHDQLKARCATYRDLLRAADTTGERLLRVANADDPTLG